MSAASTGPPGGTTVPGNRWDLLDGREPPEPPTVTVVVTHFEQPVELLRTLLALGRQTHPADRLEVVVADDGSGSAPAVPDGVRLVTQPDRGFRAAAARNLGASVAGGEVLCFLDADTTPEPAYVERLVRLVALAPEVVTVGRREHADLRGVPVDVPVEDAGPSHRLPAPRWLADGYDRSRDLLDADDLSYRYVLSSVLACSRWLFELTGGFDPSFTAYGGEDWEWADRAWEEGALLAHVPNAVAWHDGPDSAGRLAAEEQARRKNAETLTLVDRGIPGLRPRSLRLGPPEVELRLADPGSPAGLVVAVDELLTVLPGALVRLPSEPGVLTRDARVVTGGEPSGARVVVDVDGDARLDPVALTEALSLLGGGEVGSVLLQDGAGVTGAVARRARAGRRADRWGRDDLFATVERRGAVTRRPSAADLEAHLGGWSRGA